MGHRGIGLDPVANDLKGLLAVLEAGRFRTGGTIGDASELELQGDHRRRALVADAQGQGVCRQGVGVADVRGRQAFAMPPLDACKDAGPVRLVHHGQGREHAT
jgi:hypothetical protein